MSNNGQPHINWSSWPDRQSPIYQSSKLVWKHHWHQANPEFSGQVENRVEGRSQPKIKQMQQIDKLDTRIIHNKWSWE